ncbi:MAG: tyrosine-protein phosphatase [Leucobacter sp.]
MPVSSTSAAFPISRIPLDGAHNFRDIGGFPVAGVAGGRIATGRAFRSDALNALSSADRDRISQLAIGLIVDLREERELQHAPDAVISAHTDLLNVPIFKNELFDTVTGAMSQTTDEQYDNLSLRYRDQIAAACAAVVRREDPALVHCTAGKDRTGIVIGTLLSTLGVSRDLVHHDFVVSSSFLSDSPFWDRVAEEHAAAGITGASDETARIPQRASLIERVLDAYERSYGSCADLLLAHGVTDEELDRFAHRMITV